MMRSASRCQAVCLYGECGTGWCGCAYTCVYAYVQMHTRVRLICAPHAHVLRHTRVYVCLIHTPAHINHSPPTPIPPSAVASLCTKPLNYCFTPRPPQPPAEQTAGRSCQQGALLQTTPLHRARLGYQRLAAKGSAGAPSSRARLQVFD